MNFFLLFAMDWIAHCISAALDDDRSWYSYLQTFSAPINLIISFSVGIYAAQMLSLRDPSTLSSSKKINREANFSRPGNLMKAYDLRNFLARFKSAYQIINDFFLPQTREKHNRE